jgi:hypothetical protein
MAKNSSLRVVLGCASTATTLVQYTPSPVSHSPSKHQTDRTKLYEQILLRNTQRSRKSRHSWASFTSMDSSKPTLETIHHIFSGAGKSSLGRRTSMIGLPSMQRCLASPDVARLRRLPSLRRIFAGLEAAEGNLLIVISAVVVILNHHVRMTYIHPTGQ